MVRNIVAVIGGFAIWSVLWVGGTAILQAAMPQTFHADGHVASAAALLGILCFSIVCSVVSGLATAAIGRGNLKLAVGLSVLLLAVGIFVQSQYWHVMPIWYHLSFLALLIPATLMGAVLRNKSSAMQPA